VRSGRWEVGSEMIEFLKSWVLNIATIAILLVLIEILIPSGKTKKLVNLISGFLLLITIIQPYIS
jgi:stage III sporulation protein AF